MLFRNCKRLSGCRIPDFPVPWQARASRSKWESRLPDWVVNLPPASRTVIVLQYLEEMSLEEVAAVLDIATGTVKSRLAYGLARLRRHTAGTQMKAEGGTHT